MIDIQLKLAAEEFVRYLKSSQPVKKFLASQSIFQSNTEILKLREDFTSIVKIYRQKEADGNLTENDIHMVRDIQKRLNTHPITIEYVQSQQEMIMMLQDCNNAISNILGFDFAATAAPTASC